VTVQAIMFMLIKPPGDNMSELEGGKVKTFSCDNFKSSHGQVDFLVTGWWHCFSSTRTRNYDFGNERIYADSTWQSERDIVYVYMPVYIHVYICTHIYIYTHIYKVLVCPAIHILKETYNTESGPPLCDHTLHTALALSFAVAMISSQRVEETRII